MVAETHALENPGAIPLEMIEVQSGSYLGEDDRVEQLASKSTQIPMVEQNSL